METHSTEARLSRRHVLQWIAAAAATEGIALPGFAQEVKPATKGYGTDPDLVKIYQPGDVWPLILSPKEKKAATALADIILPADDLGPAASEVRVPDYVDEWISAPYPRQVGDRGVVVPGLKWLDAESQKRFQKDFAALTEEQQKAICDDLCEPKPGMEKAAHFFHVFSTIASGAYFSTQPGWKAIGYVGNMPSINFDGPPKEVLDKLGLEQTVE
ncbi:MAG: gluconate 2-dehydrogenase subunit 3 family protein [Akkermansiaceae bacterium]